MWFTQYSGFVPYHREEKQPLIEIYLHNDNHKVIEISDQCPFYDTQAMKNMHWIMKISGEAMWSLHLSINEIHRGIASVICFPISWGFLGPGAVSGPSRRVDAHTVYIHVFNKKCDLGLCRLFHSLLVQGDKGAFSGFCIQWKFLSVLLVYSALPLRHSSPIFRPTHHKMDMPANEKQHPIPHWQPCCHQARTV